MNRPYDPITVPSLRSSSNPPACAAALVAFHPFLMDGQSEDCPYAVPSGTAAITSLATPSAQPASEAAPEIGNQMPIAEPNHPATAGHPSEGGE